MEFLILKHNGMPFAVVTGGSIEDVEKHIRNGWPNLVDFLADITGEIANDVSAVSFTPPPESERTTTAAFVRKSFLVAFNHENRLRALEGKAPVTREQFRTALVNL